MITYSDALDILLSKVPLIPTEIVHLNEVLGRVCAQTIYSPEAMPSFTNSAMDGFAIQSKSLKDCSPTNPVYLSVVGSVAAGDAPISISTHINPACEIMTGAVVPDGFDAVIPIEAVTVIDNKKVIIQQTLVPGQNIRYPGEDIQINDLILSAGTIIEPQHIMILASLGITQIKVYRKIKIVILSTGNELVNIETKNLATGQIRNSNGIYLAHALQTPSVHAEFLGSFSDDLNTVKNIIMQLQNGQPAPDLIITTGAVSAGKWDFIPTLLSEINADILFHKVAIRPGKPILAARLSEHTYFFGLPGNPISTAVGLRFFVKPLLRSMQGRALEKTLHAKLKNPLNKKHNLHTFYKAHIQVNSLGELIVDILSGQESFKMKPLLTANCWAALCEAKEYHQHELIDVYEEI
jgi:molybdopterin molybdotransferase